MIDATQVLESAGGGALLPIWAGTGFADDVDFVAVPGRRLDFIPTTFLEHETDISSVTARRVRGSRSSTWSPYAEATIRTRTSPVQQPSGATALGPWTRS
jgi:hypothetical protein